MIYIYIYNISIIYIYIHIIYIYIYIERECVCVWIRAGMLAERRSTSHSCSAATDTAGPTPFHHMCLHCRVSVPDGRQEG